MRFIVMFVTAVCVLFVIKLRWPKRNNFYDIEGLLFLALSIMMKKSLLLNNITNSRLECKHGKSHILCKTKMAKIDTLKRLKNHTLRDHTYLYNPYECPPPPPPPPAAGSELVQGAICASLGLCYDYFRYFVMYIGLVYAHVLSLGNHC